MSRGIIIYGCGQGGRQALRTIASGEHIIAFSDRDPDKQKTQFLGYRVLRPQALLEHKEARILIASQYRDEIARELLAFGVAREQIEVLEGLGSARFVPWLPWLGAVAWGFLLGVVILTIDF